MSLKSKVANGLKWSFIETIGIRLFSVSTYFILARLLDPTAFGLVALTNTFIFFSEIFIEQGFVAALVQKKELNNQHLYSAFWGNLAMGVLLFGLTVVGAPLVASLYKEPVLADILRVHAVTYIISSFSKVQLAILQRDLKFKKIAIARTTATIISCSVSIVLAVLGYGVWSLVFQQIIFNLLQTLIIWATNRWVPTLSFSWMHYKSIFSYGSKTMLNRFTHYMIRYTDSLLIGFFLGTSILGYYSFAKKIVITLTDLLGLTFNKVTFSVFAMLQDQQKMLARKFHVFIDLMATLSFPLFAGSFIFIPHLLPLFFGDKWDASIPIIQILSIAGVFTCFYSCLNSLFGGIGRVGLNLKIKFMFLIINLILTYVAVQFSVEWVAVSYVLSLTITLIVLVSYVRNFITINSKLYLITIAKPLFFSVLIAILVQLSSYTVDNTTLPFRMLQILAGIVLYTGYLIVLKPGFLQEVKSLSKRKSVKTV